LLFAEKSCAIESGVFLVRVFAHHPGAHFPPCGVGVICVLEGGAAFRGFAGSIVTLASVLVASAT